ncbi:MAG: protein-export chaperone SecB [Pseudomonadota bacterium]
MSDETEAAAGEAPAQQFSIKKLYVKDLSFESPKTPEVFGGKAARNPNINLQINTETRPGNDDMFEVVLNITVTATVEDSTLYLVEIKQAGLFLIKGFDQSVRDNLLGSHCPSALFPFAREVIAGMVAKGGFPQLILEPINFDALYAQHLSKIKQNAPAPDTPQ